MERRRGGEEVLVPPLSSDECGQSGGEADSDEDIITDYHIPTLDMLPRPGPLPTISVTPHSPANKTYPVLEDSLQQVRELHESVQRMRDATIQGSNGFGGAPTSRDFAALALNPLLAQVARISASCPTLNEKAVEADMLGGSLGSSPVHLPSSRKGSGAQDWLLGRNLEPDPHRRKSWSALEDLSGTKDKIKTRQRSISLSSMESEADESSLLDTVDGSGGGSARLLGTDSTVVGRRSHRGSGGGASTHSLNEADLQNDFNKIKAKREAEQLRLLPARLPLQKSISTPSIIAVRDLVPEPALIGAQPTLPVGRPSGTESETEEEGSRSSRIHFDPTSSIAHLHHVAYDHPEKRRKRGSLFFRKKKDKNKQRPHQWTSPGYGASQLCDWCVKPLSNKPSLYCENCGTTVHQNTCKDNILECNKPKVSKNSNKISGFVAPLTNSKSSISKRGSTSMPGSNQNSSSNRRSQLCYSPWRRVATKLGVNQILSDDRDSDVYHGHHDNINFPDDVPLVPLEFLSDAPLIAADLCSDRSLGLHESEPDSWTPHVGKEISRKLKEKDVKRQEHIYEFILTEKHHCMTLLVMKKVFVDGLQKYFNLGPKLERMFPRLADLTELHLGFLSRLRQRQREAPVVSSIADILLEQFSTSYAAKLKSAYGEFCSRHRDAVDIYKHYLSNDERFSQFVRHCQNNPLLKKKGIPECILFVTQRLTKYPLLIEPLIKTSKDDPHEQEQLQRVLALVKEILVEVDSQVAEKEKEDRKLEIYNRIEAKSCIEHRGETFRKSDILQGNRSLKFEGVATLVHNRFKNDVIVIVLSDVLFFLEENSHNKYAFVKPNKAGVIPLEKLLVRDQAGQELRGIYLINQEDPEMLQLKVQKPKDKTVWIESIRAAVKSCINSKQDKLKNIVGLLKKKDEEQAILLEEKMALQLKLLEAAGHDPPSPPTYRHLVGDNLDNYQLWREVLLAVQEISQLASSLYTTGTNLSRSVSSAGEHQSDAYTSPILPKRAETFGGFDNSLQSGGMKLQNKKLQMSSGTHTLSPDLENLKPGDSRILEKLPWRNCQITGGGTLMNGNVISSGTNDYSQQQQNTGPPDLPALFSLGKEQQYAAVHLSHYVYTLLSIISRLITKNESLRANLLSLRGNGDSGKQQLEELRNLQDKLSEEKSAWNAHKEQESRELEEKKQELTKLQEQIRAEQSDIAQQREQLYRKMEILTSQGRLISPNVALPVLGQMEDSSNQSSEESSPSQSEGSLGGGASSGSLSHSHSMSAERRKDPKWNKSTSKSQLPQHLISATNQQKVSQNVQIKQQLPLKLASKLSASGASSPLTGSSVAITGIPGPQQMLPLKLSQDEKVRRTSSTGYQRLGSGSRSPTSGESTPPTPHSHSRTGSSPAMMQQASPPGGNNGQLASIALQGLPGNNNGNNKAARTHTYPKLPDKYKVRGGTGGGNGGSNNEPSSPQDEEVIYF